MNDKSRKKKNSNNENLNASSFVNDWIVNNRIAKIRSLTSSKGSLPNQLDP